MIFEILITEANPLNWEPIWQLITVLIVGGGGAGAMYGGRRWRNGRSNGSNGKLDVRTLYAEQVQHQGKIADAMVNIAIHAKATEKGITYLVNRERFTERKEEIKKIRKEERRKILEEMKNK